MKTLISQNNVKIFFGTSFKEFNCLFCGAKFSSDEYKVENTKGETIYSDTCFTCNNICIIKDKTDGED